MFCVNAQPVKIWLETSNLQRIVSWWCLDIADSHNDSIKNLNILSYGDVTE